MPRSISSSAPIPIPQKDHPTKLHKLIATKHQWQAVIERCASHPHEVGGSSSNLRNDKGYTALHMVTAYNHGSHGKELVPVIKAILRAADEIDYAAAYKLGEAHDEEEDVDETKVNTNEITEGGDNNNDVVLASQEQLTRGSWRLLLDNNNRAKWAPLHLICVQGGIVHGKVAALKALLQIDDNENEQVNIYQKQIVTLLDRQNRNVLHHLLDTVVPSDETFQAIRFIVSMIPSLLLQKDIRDKTPLQYVLERIMENPSSRRRHYMNSYGNDGEGIRKNYRMLKLLVECMQRETRGWEEEEEVSIEDVQEVVETNKRSLTVAVEEGETSSALRMEINHHPNNVLQSACLLPASACPPNGSLLKYLCSDDASKLEAEVRDDHYAATKPTMINMASEKDENGNLALHLYASNKSYASNFNCSKEDSDKKKTVRVRGEENSNNDSNNQELYQDYKTIKSILDSYPSAISTPNNNNELPLQIAMRAGRRRAVTVLLSEYPEAVLLDEDMNDNKLFMHALSCISSQTLEQVERKRHLTTMFKLLTARPDIVGLAGTGTKSEKDKTIKPKKKQWWKNLNPFS